MQTPVDVINSLAKRIISGEDPTPEEMYAAIQQIRSERGSIAQAKEEKARKASTPIDIASLFAKKEPSA